MTFRAINPASGEELSTYPCATPEQVERTLDRSRRVQAVWSRRTVRDRAARLSSLAVALRRHREKLAALMADEMGKPVAQGKAEVAKSADCCDYYARNASAMLASVEVPTEAHRSYWSYEPLGTVLGIMPWNFPVWQVVRFAAPALTSGNAVVVKHAPSVPGCALALQRLFQDAGYDGGLYANLFVDIRTTGQLLADPRIAAVSLTGSVEAGREVAARAGRAVKKCVLELGGSDPAIILDDSDVRGAAEICAWGRFRNAGQSCIATKRMIAVGAALEPFERALRVCVAEMRQGSPRDPATRIGPMARVDLRDRLHLQVVRSVAMGARLEAGGEVPPGPGAWYPPTLLTEVARGMPAYAEELFGPVAVVIPARNEDEAVRIANDTAFGLGASVFTSDRKRGEEIARERLQAGSCFVNRAVESVPSLPFGGIKESGYGRELSSIGLAEFTNVKTVYVA